MSEAAAKMVEAILGTGEKPMTVAFAETAPDGSPSVLSKFHTDFLSYFEYRKAQYAVMLEAIVSLSTGGSSSQEAMAAKKTLMDRLGSVLKGTGQAGGFIANQYVKLYSSMFKGAGTAISGAFGFGKASLPFLGRGAKNLGDMLTKLLSGGMDMYGNVYGSLAKAGGGVLTAGINALSGATASPYVDVYRKDNIKDGDPLISAKDQRKYAMFKSGARLEQSADITEPLYHIKTQDVLVTQDDIEAGLVDRYGKPLGRVMTGAGGGLLRSAIKGLGGAGKMISDLLGQGIGAYGNIYKGLAGFGGKVGGAAVSGIFDLFGGKQSKEVVTRLDTIIALLQERLPKRRRVLGDHDADGIREGSYEDQMLEAAQQGGPSFLQGDMAKNIGDLAMQKAGGTPGQPGAPQAGGSSWLAWLLGGGSALKTATSLGTQVARHGAKAGSLNYLKGTNAAKLFNLGKLGMNKFGGTALGKGLGRFASPLAKLGGGAFKLGGNAARFGGRFAGAAALPLLTAYEAASGLRETIGDSGATDAYTNELERKQADYGGPLGSLAQVFGLENVAKEMQQGNYLKAGWQGAKGLFGSVGEAGKLVGANVNMGAQAIHESKGSDELQQLHQALLGIGAVKDPIGWGDWKVVSWYKIKSLSRKDLMTLATSDKFAKSDIDMFRKLALDKYMHPKTHDSEDAAETPEDVAGKVTKPDNTGQARNEPGSFWDRMSSLTEEELIKRINDPRISEDDKAGYRRSLAQRRLKAASMSAEADSALDEFGYTENSPNGNVPKGGKPGEFWDRMSSLTEEELIKRINDPRISEDDKAGYRRSLAQRRAKSATTEVMQHTRFPNSSAIRPGNTAADSVSRTYQKSAADRAVQDALSAASANKPPVDAEVAKKQIEQQSTMITLFQQMTEYIKKVASNTDELGGIKTGLDDNLKDATKKQPVVVVQPPQNNIKVDRPALNLAKAT
jgi:hypothetical protein